MGRGLGGMRDKAICGSGLRAARNGKKPFTFLRVYLDTKCNKTLLIVRERLKAE